MLFQSPSNNAQAHRLVSKLEYYTNLNKAVTRENMNKQKLAYSYQYCPISPFMPFSHRSFINVEKFTENLTSYPVLCQVPWIGNALISCS